MSTSAGVNVLRYSALGLGVFYGFYHQRKIYSADKVAAAKQEYEHKQKLIEQAKAEYSKSKLPPSSGSGLNQDPTDPKFDLEAYLESLAKANP
ncbi:mitochondrial ATPase, f0 complex, subunit e [Grosmannia clavigera kw1407]|uniref:ATP synthase F(0) complex subunit e, mitochondrial n=1 Tax=Grosmannia clavigera (strain kw1407 / UAMH 11150) TaxID=655863 RepID=F0XSC6_GROCL|nr:mitochondrial ATPase, f0 complex, subunit e [Grosmannia clavigera kw1407]EFW99490.1 mitochondrial ATPase, f0 complex, subunit e [Grosmannia clavigera kw1407]